MCNITKNDRCFAISKKLEKNFITGKLFFNENDVLKSMFLIAFFPIYLTNLSFKVVLITFNCKFQL